MENRMQKVDEIKTTKEAKEALNKMRAGGVGQINPYPYVEVLFKTLARTAIQKSERGVLCILVEDTTSIEQLTYLKSVADINSKKWTEENVKLLGTAFNVFSPNKVLVVRKGDLTTENFLNLIKSIKITHLACPGLESEEDAKVVSWVKTMEKTKGIVYVSAFSNNSDSTVIVELYNKTIKHKNIVDYTPQMFTVMVAGAIAGCPLNRSLDNIIFPNITEVDVVEPKNGKFLMYNDDGDIRVQLAINSKTTFDDIYKEQTRFIKVVEGINIVKFDIIDTFNKYWLGLYINDYQNKMAFCNIINKTYFKELQPNVLSADYENRVDIDIEAQKRWIATEGKDPETLSETEIKRYPTGHQVFLTGDVRFSNVMIDLQLVIGY